MLTFSRESGPRSRRQMLAVIRALATELRETGAGRVPRLTASGRDYGKTCTASGTYRLLTRAMPRRGRVAATLRARPCDLGEAPNQWKAPTGAISIPSGRFRYPSADDA